MPSLIKLLQQDDWRFVILKCASKRAITCCSYQSLCERSRFFFSPLWPLTLHPIHSSSLLPRSASRSLLERSSPRNMLPPNPTCSYHHFTLETYKSLLHQKLKLKVAIVLKIAELSHTSLIKFFKPSNLKASILSLKEIFS